MQGKKQAGRLRKRQNDNWRLDRQAVRQRGRQTDRQTGRQTDRQAGSLLTDIKTVIKV